MGHFLCVQIQHFYLEWNISKDFIAIKLHNIENMSLMPVLRSFLVLGNTVFEFLQLIFSTRFREF